MRLAGPVRLLRTFVGWHPLSAQECDDKRPDAAGARGAQKDDGSGEDEHVRIGIREFIVGRLGRTSLP